MRRAPILVPTALAALVVLGGCGGEDERARSSPPKPSTETRRVSVARAGLVLSLPRNLKVTRNAPAPAAFKAALGEPFVSAFAYPRSEQLPRTAAELAEARRRLSRTVSEREPGYRLLRSDATEADGAPAVELLGRQTVSRRKLQIRSLHVFKGRAEYVVEVVAPVEQFESFDTAITPLIERSIDVSGTVRPAR